MRNRRVQLLDIGLDASFDASMTFVQSTLQNLNAGQDQPMVDIDFIRTRDSHTVFTAFTAPCDILHVMAHGNYAANPTFVSSDERTSVSLADLTEYSVSWGRGISTKAVLADGCRTGTGVWQKAVRDCLQGDITYIGTSAAVGWHEGTVFASAFYGAMFRNKGKGLSIAEQAQDAAERAIRAYSQITDRACPYRVVTLTPSRRAKWALPNSGPGRT